LAPENLQTETLLATKILNISCATLVAVSQEILLGYQNCYLTLWLRRFVYNCNVVCGIIPDVMTLSSGWRHFNSNMTLQFQKFNFRYKALTLWLRLEHICPLGKKFTFIFIFFKNKLLKYVIIRLHNLKSDTDIAHIEPL
jgi:hypothetical protein